MKSKLARKLGLHIFSSCSGFQEALDGYKGNGLFSGSLLKALSGKNMGVIGDSRVTAVAIGRFAKQETEEVSRAIKHPQNLTIINFGMDFPMFAVK